MADETLSAYSTRQLQADVERSRESAAKLLENLSRKIGASRAVRSAASGVQRAADYVQGHSVREVASEVERAMRSRPVASIAVAAVAGFFIGRALRPR